MCLRRVQYTLRGILLSAVRRRQLLRPDNQARMGCLIAMMFSNHLWYLAYGSNMLESRLRAYIEGTSTGPYGAHKGSRDRRGPTGNRSVRTGHNVYFAGQSIRWNGPVAFLELTSTDSFSLGRAYLLTWNQIVDIAAQENGDAKPYSHRTLPPINCYIELQTKGKYNIILRLEDHEEIPTVTLTTSRDLPRGEPTPEYLAAMRQGFSNSEISPMMTSISTSIACFHGRTKRPSSRISARTCSGK